MQRVDHLCMIYHLTLSPRHNWSLAPLSVLSGNTQGVTGDVACLQLPMSTWRTEASAAIGRYGSNLGGESSLKDQ